MSTQTTVRTNAFLNSKISNHTPPTHHYTDIVAYYPGYSDCPTQPHQEQRHNDQKFSLYPPPSTPLTQLEDTLSDSLLPHRPTEAPLGPSGQQPHPSEPTIFAAHNIR